MKRKLLIVAATFMGLLSSTALYASPTTLLDKMFLGSGSYPMTACVEGSGNFCSCMATDEINGCLNDHLAPTFCKNVNSVIQQICTGEGIKYACVDACGQYHNICNSNLCPAHPNNPWKCLVTQFKDYLSNCLHYSGNCKS